MERQHAIMEALKHPPLPCSESGAYSKLYAVTSDTHLVMKFFSMRRKKEAQREYHNLQEIAALSDPRIRVPRGEAFVEIDPAKDSPDILIPRGYGVVMERICAIPWNDLSNEQKPPCRSAIVELMDAFWDHDLRRNAGPKREEVFCLPTGKVAVVDTHSIQRGIGQFGFSFEFATEYITARPHDRAKADILCGMADCTNVYK